MRFGIYEYMNMMGWIYGVFVLFFWAGCEAGLGKTRLDSWDHICGLYDR